MSEHHQSTAPESELSPIEKWSKIKAFLTTAKEKEAQMRRDLCADILEGVPMDKGKARLKDVIQGYGVTAVQELSYSLDVDLVKEMWSDLSDAEKECVKTKVYLWDTGYKKLPADSLLHQAVTTRLAMPKLEAKKLEE